jgi:catechol 2,3-dioxygenase-like lactoylglutathione lyase family enzyme
MESAQLIAAAPTTIFVKALDHVNVRTHDVQGTVSFFSDVLGLTAGQAPGMNANEFAWLFTSAGAPIFHVQLDKSDSPATLPENRQGTGPIDHIALDCAGHDAAIGRLKALGITYRLNDVPAANLKQVFLVDPNGILLELNYRD